MMDPIVLNLTVVEEHFRTESENDIRPALPLYTEDIIWEAPARGILLRGKAAAEENYAKMFAAMDFARVRSLRRFATPDRVVDDAAVSFKLAGEGLENSPLPVGSNVEMRVVHIFDMQDGRIARETVYEMWPDTAARAGNGAARTGSRAPRAATEAAGALVATAELTPEPLLQAGMEFWGSRTLLSAVELGVFTELAAGPLTERQLAERLGLHRRSSRDFLDSLVALGFLDRRGGKYENVPLTDRFLDRAKPTYVGGILEMAGSRLYRYWGGLTQALRTGLPQNEILGGGDDLFATLYKDPQKLREFLGAMTGVSLSTAKAIARKFPWERYRTFVDVGTAQGAAAVQVALANPHLTGMGFDLPAAQPIFEDYVRSFGLDGRLRFHSGDFFAEPIPGADVLIMGHILHDWDLDEKRRLLAKAHTALPAGGALIVYEALIDDDRRRNAFGLLMSLNMLIETRGGFDYTGADCSQWMREAGFRETWVEHLAGPDSMVVGLK